MPAVHCHLCGATLRRAEQFDEIWRRDRGDVIFVCRDARRCVIRAAYDPPARRKFTPEGVDTPGR
jgi:alpha-D-ribose 1-methylphosphonate 5-phosphate C-P lyase